jgi:hypothetical protein
MRALSVLARFAPSACELAEHAVVAIKSSDDDRAPRASAFAAAGPR